MPWKITLTLILCCLSGGVGWQLRDTSEPALTAYRCSRGIVDALVFWD